MALFQGNHYIQSMALLKALTIRQPWAWLIVAGHKPVENRSWSTKYRGPLAIHAGLSMSAQDYENACEVFGKRIDRALLQFGGIIGSANLVNVVSCHRSRFFFGPLGFILDDATPLPFKPMKGALGLWTIRR